MQELSQIGTSLTIRTGIEVTSSGKLKVWLENCLKNDMPVLA